MLDLQSHFLFDFLEALDCKFKVFLAVSCGDLRTDARLAHGHNGVAEAYYIHALFKHARGKFLRSAVEVVSISSTFKLAAHMAGASALLKRYGLLRCLSRSIISFFAQV